MRCANPDCNQSALDLLTGTLRLIELDVPPDERVVRSDWGFPICAVPSKYFWLCGECSRLLKMKRWTRDGLILESRALQSNGLDDVGVARFVAKGAPCHRLQVVIGKTA
jgi:hypothetical protein